ncbi:hypothetical protein SACS_0314 [Parasaccharibacter apium]|uniref:Uncharacterized protein n=1 Tax=Parasaccharibacter apium TaxID=1510841 RepID=A0A7U7J0H5_9PROT|nr:hypothetical protein SACS_0314 [Parasaccharibacter apium]
MTWKHAISSQHDMKQACHDKKDIHETLRHQPRPNTRPA